MPVNKVIFDNETLIDITDSTITADTILDGYEGYSKSGSKITGNVVVHRYYTGTADPSSSLGSDGDLYLKVSN